MQNLTFATFISFSNFNCQVKIEHGYLVEKCNGTVAARGKSWGGHHAFFVCVACWNNLHCKLSPYSDKYFSFLRGPNGVWTLEEKGLKPDINISFDVAAPTKTHMAIVKLVESGELH